MIPRAKRSGVRGESLKSYPNIKKVLDSLKKLGLKTGIVTSRYKNTSQTLAAAGIKNNFDVVITGDDVVKSKPDPECLFLALRKLKVKSVETILVGDAAVDIEIGKMVGIKTVGVTYGFGGKEIAKSKPDYVIDEIGQLLEILYLYLAKIQEARCNLAIISQQRIEEDCVLFKFLIYF